MNKTTRRAFGFLLAAAGVFAYGHFVASGVSRKVLAQESAPNRRDVTISIKDHRFSPDRIEVQQDDLVKITVSSEDIAHSFTIDEYRIAKRIAGGGTLTFEFRADRAGTFPFYCNLTSEPGHGAARGQLVVRPRT
jgi:heme/copper-type cytochrome/quinol oxidase subunit 2